MSELNESANQLSKNSGKKHVKKCQQRLQIFSSILISRDKNFILLLACFGLIFTRSLTWLSLRFFSHYIPFPFPVALEQNLILRQQSLLIFQSESESISELNINR